MVWEPYALAVVFGVVVSAAIYFVVMWPQVEPPDEEDLAVAGVAPSPAEPAPEKAPKVDADAAGADA